MSVRFVVTVCYGSSNLHLEKEWNEIIKLKRGREEMVMWNWEFFFADCSGITVIYASLMRA